MHCRDDIARRIAELESKAISEITGDELLELERLTAAREGRNTSVLPDFDEFYEDYEWR